MTKRSAFTLIACIAALLASVATLGIAQDRDAARASQSPSVARPCSSDRVRTTSSTTWTRAPLKEHAAALRATGRSSATDFSIGHRGAALQFPEHTKESYEAGARMGAGILECDVTFTKDRAARLPPLAVRPAHHDQHPRDPRAGREVHAAVHARRSGDRHAGVGEVLHERHHARRVQDAVRQDGRVEPERDDASRSTWTARRASAPTCTRPAARC